ncbi:uncharacterized protein RHOBADRAFT_52669 [Rhodotorula graminis WP1]|uniref:Zn(2)-C6 fungal-type domain-containing protein n=1 Tax=Rhodotorula graminis (strain WP1) TaxID=578459 RepID=A0A194S532_RHOGW|nr:uncharacterized protein RHOBADRAFT_52669 [Rhodotorula graminis WP1]KPV75620.1 hypothetical protein RHOBADRAFT_52669 [Rhodotorula graminis WP1]
MATTRRPADETPPVRAKRLRRSAAARCDGPPGPCHRCATSGIDCVFPPSTGPAPSRASPATSLPPPLARTPVAAQPEASGSTPIATASSSSVTFDSSHATDISQQLALANSRLEILQATLDSVLSRQDEASQHSSDAASAALQGGSFLSNDASAAADETSAMSALMLAEASAASVLASASIASAAKRQREGASSAQELLKPDWSIAMPDVLERGIMTLDECEAEFDIFFTHIQPWAALLSVALDRQPLAVRARSPLLFHAILLLALYYRPRTRANLARYCAVSSLVDALLAPQILCPQANDLSGGDFVRAVHLLLMYKPVQYARLEACGVTDASAVESSSKMNVAASWMLRLLVSRVSTFIGLPSIADSFAQAFANQQFVPIADTLVSQERLYLDCVFRELTGALQSGKSANFTPQAACRTTRLFAHLARQPSDVRLAASVELVAAAAEALAISGVPSSDTLRQFDVELANWTSYWRPRLTPATAPDDAVRWSVFVPYAGFTRLVVRGFLLPTWRAKREAANLAASASGAAGAVTLGDEEHEHIAHVVAVAEEMLLAMTVEGRSLREGVPGARVEWDSLVQQLVPDPAMCELCRWATDSLTCVMFAYPLIMLNQLAEEGLVFGDLSVLASGSSPSQPKPMSADDKLSRLLALGAELLEAVAPNPVHPARGQAAFLRKVRQARIAPSSEDPTPQMSPRRRASASAAGAEHPHLSTATHDSLAPSTAFLPYASTAAVDSLAMAYQPTPLNSPPFPATTPLTGMSGVPLNLDALPGLLAGDGWTGGAVGAGVFDDPLVGWSML